MYLYLCYMSHMSAKEKLAKPHPKYWCSGHPKNFEITVEPEKTGP